MESSLREITGNLMGQFIGLISTILFSLSAFIETNKENGERNVLCPKVPSPAPPMPPPKPGNTSVNHLYVQIHILLLKLFVILKILY